MELTINDIFLLREWAPLNELLNKIPSRWYSGIFVSDLSLTCIDVLPDFIALGTNAGIAFWYDRRKGDLQRLRCEGQSQVITTIKAVSSVDYMVACGTENGLISVFTIPKEIPINVPTVEVKQKPAERYCIRDLHISAITSLEWSKNGMKLFSGDKNGCVVLTEIDFYMHLCKSSELLNESYEVVQLNYNHPKLIVSTIFRTIITEKKSSKWEVLQVGRQDRKCLSKFGSIFAPVEYPREINNIYCCRPGHRLWISDCEGNVEKTLFFKDTLHKPKVSVPILNPSNTRGRITVSQLPGFGILHPYGPFLMTHSKDVMYIIDPSKPQVLAVMTQFRSILSASICEHEIFILEGSRSLIRISTAPDNNIIKSDSNFAAIITNPIISTLNSLKNFNIDETVETSMDNDHIINAEECFELPPVQKLPSDLTGLKIHNTPFHSKVEVFNKISEQQFDENILFKSQIKQKRLNVKEKINTVGNSEEKIISSANENENITTTSPCLMTLSFCNKDDIIVPDLRSPQTIEKDIEYKEKKLAEVLHLEKITIQTQQASIVESSIEINLLPDIKALAEAPHELKKFNIGIEDETNTEDAKPKLINDGLLSGIESPKIIDVPVLWNLQEVQIKKKLSDTAENISINEVDSDWEVL